MEDVSYVWDDLGPFSSLKDLYENIAEEYGMDITESKNPQIGKRKFLTLIKKGIWDNTWGERYFNIIEIDLDRLDKKDYAPRSS